MAEASKQENDDDEEEDDDDIAFASIDFSGVNFDEENEVRKENEKNMEIMELALKYEDTYLLADLHGGDNEEGEEKQSTDDANKPKEEKLEDIMKHMETDFSKYKPQMERIRMLSEYHNEGRYADILRSESAQLLLSLHNFTDSKNHCFNEQNNGQFFREIRTRIESYCHDSTLSNLEAEFIGVAALNLFLQLNYTGPNLDGGVAVPGQSDTLEKMGQVADSVLKDIDPHPAFHFLFGGIAENNNNKHTHNADHKNFNNQQLTTTTTTKSSSSSYRNNVLAELSVDGEWPCPTCRSPYLFLLARSILWILAHPTKQSHWSTPTQNEPTSSSSSSSPLKGFTLWNGRAAVAHCRLLQSLDDPPLTLWHEVNTMYQSSIQTFHSHDNNTTNDKDEAPARVMLEWGLAQYHFNRNANDDTNNTKQKTRFQCFQNAMQLSGLVVQVTGSTGRRTKYQKKATAQMKIRATPTGN